MEIDRNRNTSITSFLSVHWTHKRATLSCFPNAENQKEKDRKKKKIKREKIEKRIKKFARLKKYSYTL